MKNISEIHSCYGCGVCAIGCGKKIIDIVVNKDGFYEPHITDISKCTYCGLCLDVCSYYNEGVLLDNEPKLCVGAWSKEPAVRQVSASGGAGFEIGRYLINNGYKAIAVKYNVDEQRAEHYMASSVEEFVYSMGSKYIQSYTLNGLRNLNRQDKFLVTGTPCQIDSLRRYIRKMRCEDNFILMDFFCHGVPSRHVWLKYIFEKQNQIGDITYVSWRNKLHGWHDSWLMVLDGKKHEGETVDWHDSYNMLIREKKGFIQSRWTQGDLFFQMFLGNNCLGKSCYNHCKFKYAHSSADIRIGDMWGETYKDNDKGVTACVAFTERGADILQKMHCDYKEYPFKVVAEGQIDTPIAFPIGWKIVINLAKSSVVSMKSLVLVSRIIGKINRLIK